MGKYVLFIIDVDDTPETMIKRWLESLQLNGEIDCFGEGKYDAATSEFGLSVIPVESSPQKFYISWLGITPQIMITHDLSGSSSSIAREKIWFLAKATLQWIQENSREAALLWNYDLILFVFKAGELIINSDEGIAEMTGLHDPETLKSITVPFRFEALQ